MFNHDYDQDGILSLEEQAKGRIAFYQMVSTMDKMAYGVARQVRMGVEYYSDPDLTDQAFELRCLIQSTSQERTYASGPINSFES